MHDLARQSARASWLAAAVVSSVLAACHTRPAPQDLSVGEIAGGKECLERFPRDADSVGKLDLSDDPLGKCRIDTARCLYGSGKCPGRVDARICDLSAVITRDAAICIARLADMEDGLRGIDAHLHLRPAKARLERAQLPSTG